MAEPINLTKLPPIHVTHTETLTKAEFDKKRVSSKTQITALVLGALFLSAGVITTVLYSRNIGIPLVNKVAFIASYSLGGITLLWLAACKCGNRSLEQRYRRHLVDDSRDKAIKEVTTLEAENVSRVSEFLNFIEFVNSNQAIKSELKTVDRREITTLLNIPSAEASQEKKWVQRRVDALEVKGKIAAKMEAIKAFFLKYPKVYEAALREMFKEGHVYLFMDEIKKAIRPN